MENLHLGLDQELILLIIVSGLVRSAAETLVELGHNSVAGRVHGINNKILNKECKETS